MTWAQRAASFPEGQAEVNTAPPEPETYAPLSPTYGTQFPRLRK